MLFQLQSEYEPRGDQPQAIERLVDSIRAGNRHQTLLGVTGSGKPCTLANVIASTDLPATLLSPEKTLTAQTHPSLLYTPSALPDYHHTSLYG